MFIQMSFCSSSDPEIIALITFMTCGFKLLMWSLIVQYAVSSPFYFLSARCSWVESNNCCKIFQDCIRHICIYDKSFSFWQNTCALLAFHLLRCTDPLFFLDGNFWLKLLLTGCNPFWSRHRDDWFEGGYQQFPTFPLCWSPTTCNTCM